MTPVTEVDPVRPQCAHRAGLVNPMRLQESDPGGSCEVDGAAPTLHAIHQNGKAFKAMLTIICSSDLDAPFAL